MKSIIVSVEGNIGSGKSTFLKNLEKKFGSGSPTKFVFVQEPVSEWTKVKDDNGVDMLSKFYADQEKYSFAFQMMAYISRLSLLKRAYQENPTDAIIITERSVHTDRYVFAKMLYDDKKIEDVEYKIYLKWFDEFIEELPISGIVYLHTTPEISHQRLLKRAREGEGTVPLEYLKNCYKYHEDWLNNEKSVVRVLDVSGENNEENNLKWEQEFMEFLAATI